MTDKQVNRELSKWGEKFFDLISFTNPDVKSIEMSKRISAVLERGQIWQKQFSSEKDFRSFARSEHLHLSDAQFEEKLEALVAENAFALKLLCDDTGIDYQSQSPEQQLMALANTHYVDPTPWFPSMPPSEPVCGLKQLFEHFGEDVRKTEAVAAHLQASAALMANRYRVTTGKNLSFSDLPFLAELTSRKAPIPWQTGWSDQWSSAEARMMKHLPNPGSSTPANGVLNGSNAPVSGRCR